MWVCFNAKKSLPCLGILQFERGNAASIMGTLRKFEDFFDVDYPIPKMDMIGVPAFKDSNSMAMENCGIVTYDPQYLLYNASVMTEK